MFLTLSNLTGLTLHPLVADNDTDSDTGSYLGELMDTEDSNDNASSKSNEKPRRKKRRRLNTGGDSSSQEGTEGTSEAENNEDITDRSKGINSFLLLLRDNLLFRAKSREEG